jgi:predicted permease
MSVFTTIFHLVVEVLLEFLVVIFAYELVSYCQAKFSKKSKKKFSIKETFNEAWIICFVIALVIIIVNHLF